LLSTGVCTAGLAAPLPELSPMRRLQIELETERSKRIQVSDSTGHIRPYAL
jgi:hypothetical protein